MKHCDHKYEVGLSEEQRFALQHLISQGKAPARQLAHARILLKIDRNGAGCEWTDEQVAEAFARQSLHRDASARALRQPWSR